MFQLINKIYGCKWAMDEMSLTNLCNTVESMRSMRVGGVKGFLMGNPLLIQKQENILDPIITSQNNEVDSDNNIAIIRVSGILTKGGGAGLSDMEMAMGFTNIDDVYNALQDCADDPTISAIVLAFASPGGETCGIVETGRLISEIDANVKPVYGWTEQQASSAAYWLISQCRKIGMTESANVGSVGVYMVVPDLSEKYEKEGINFQVISSGKYKLMGHDHKPLNEDEEKILTKDVIDQHQKFKDVIKDKRKNISDDDLNASLSHEGPVALQKGFVDSVQDNLADYLAEVITR